ncbi:hypothetical protein [Comamonas endophytica]|uniref:Uncharacterized protein n=1 Tax=Comamonas endophytica TaxID=2949090 RepID=A0ABY6GAV5_9BURK|nr:MULTISPECIES: hypothetical protein [unclassified Acidovorax]MCD2513781.1 hypothetical protein [Acidovorax sp. D4N7]UYG52216.1 hypothetical protein M9799_02965 [Acidovorax sp. 5MLIR]
MWSVWPEKLDVYVGAGLVLVQCPGAPLWRFEPPPTLPLADVLQKVDEALGREHAKPWRLRVHLSAAFCPPVAFVAPASVRRHREMVALAQAHAALAIGMPGEQAAEIVCSLDSRHRGLAAFMQPGIYQIIQRWAQSCQGRLLGLQPLWAVATRDRLSERSQVNRLAFLEPDALTVLELSTRGAAGAMSWMRRFDAAEAVAHLAQLESRSEAPEQWNTVILTFARDPVEAVLSGGPSVLHRHWGRLP